MKLQPTTRVAIAIKANGGRTLCGFTSNASADGSHRQLMRSSGTLLRAGQAQSASVVLSIGSETKRCASLREAERELEAASVRRAADRPTAKMARQF